MFRACVRRRQQQEDEIDRPPVDRLVIDRLGKARKEAIDALEALDLGMRDGDALPKSSRTELFTLIKAGEHHRRINTNALGREVRQLLHERALAAARKRGLDRIAVKEIGKLHRDTRALVR